MLLATTSEAVAVNVKVAPASADDNDVIMAPSMAATNGGEDGSTVVAPSSLLTATVHTEVPSASISGRAVDTLAQSRVDAVVGTPYTISNVEGELTRLYVASRSVRFVCIVVGAVLL